MTDKSPYDSLFTHIRTSQDAEREQLTHEFRLHRLLNEVEAQQRKEFVASPLANMFNWGSAVAVSVAVSLTAFYVFFSPETTTEPARTNVSQLQAASGLEVKTSDSKRTIVFEDKTTVAVLPHASISIEHAGVRGARVRLHQGTLHFDGHHDKSNDWTLLAGDHKVTVLGTRFSLTFDRKTSVLDLNVTEGLVRVDGPDISRELKKGDVWSSDAPKITTLKTTHASKKRTTPRTRRAKKRAPSSDTSSASWLSLHKQRKHADAIKAARAEGLPGLLRTLGPDDLERLADSARFSREKSVARKVLTTLRKRHEASPQAPVAAYKLGLLESRAKRQAQWFSRYLKEAPRGALRREALGRLLDAQVRAASPGAKDTARQYLDAFPKGPHASHARKVLGM